MESKQLAAFVRGELFSFSVNGLRLIWVRVTVIEPGLVRTELGDHITNAEFKAGLEHRLATMEALTPEDIANAILYAVAQHPRVNVNEILIRPTDQER